MLKDLETRNFKDQYPSNVIQDNVKDLFTQLKNCPFLKGVHLKGLTVASPNIVLDVPHKLGKKPQGYIVTNANDPTVGIAANSFDEKFIHFTFTSSPLTFDVWVF
jgi:hypothetical protein